jgi:hypothetical protein
MSTNPDDRHAQYAQRRIDTAREDYSNNGKKPT